MAYDSGWTFDKFKSSYPGMSDQEAQLRADHMAAGGYSGTGMDFYQWQQHQNQMKQNEAQQNADRASLTNFIKQYQSGAMNNPAISAATAAADPWAPNRGQYVNQLNTLMQNPGSFASSPAYKFAFDQGTEALNRSMASKGLANSGTRLAELTKYGQGLAGQQYFNQANLLSKLAGVDASSPSAAAGAIASISNQQNNPVEWAKLWESGREANQQQALGVAKLGNLLKPYYAYAGA